MSYEREVPPPEYEADWWRRELEKIEQSLNGLYEEVHEEPGKPRTGMVVLADGTDWNPGSGQGLYIYYGGAWHKLG